MASIKTFMMALCCGVVLVSAVSAHAALSDNGLTANGVPLNGLAENGMPFNGLHLNGSYNGLPSHEVAPVKGPREGLPFSVISQRALGKPQP